MTLFMLFVGGMCFIGVVCLNAMRAPRTVLSDFELHRRKALGDRQAAETLKNRQLITQAALLLPALTGLLLVGLVVTMIAALGWQKGIIAALLGGLLYGTIARISLVRRLAKRLMKRYEAPVLRLLEAYPIIVKVFGSATVPPEPTHSFGSRQELSHAIDSSRGLFSDEDKKLLAGALSLRERLVSEIMTEKKAITTVPADELLGPLVLSDLYKTGHMSFPVVRGDIDHVIGMLDIRSLLTLESELSVTAMQAMTTEVVTIPASENLYSAAMLFLRSGQQVMLVVDDEGVTAGLLGLNDILQVLFQGQ